MTKNLTYANLMASIAVFVALGGTGYAAVTVNGKNIKNKSIAGEKLKNRTITGGKLSKGTMATLKGQTGGPGPAGARGATGPSNVYSAFKTGPVEISGSTTNGDPHDGVVATLTDLPPGSYSIVAKMFTADPNPPYPTGYVVCDLDTGRDFDRVQTNHQGGSAAALTLNVVRTYEGTGQAVLDCADGVANTTANFIKITATCVGALRNLPSP